MKELDIEKMLDDLRFKKRLLSSELNTAQLRYEACELKISTLEQYRDLPKVLQERYADQIEKAIL